MANTERGNKMIKAVQDAKRVPFHNTVRGERMKEALQGTKRYTSEETRKHNAMRERMDAVAKVKRASDAKKKASAKSKGK